MQGFLESGCALTRRASSGGEHVNVEVVLKVLEGFGFRRLDVPYRIGTVEFEFGSPMVSGEGHLELILVVEVDDSVMSEMFWDVQNIARALDVAGSARSITLVLVGDMGIKESASHRLHSVARVLRLGSGVSNLSSIERALAPILPLRLELSAPIASEAPLRRIERYAQAQVDAAQLKILISRSRLDAAQVEAEFLSWIEQSFKVVESDEQSS